MDMVRLAPYIRAFSGTTLLSVLDMGDMLSKRYMRQISKINANSNMGGAYTSRLSYAMKLLLKVKWIQTVILKAESKLMERSEIFWAEEYDSVILVSTVETQEINKKLSKRKAVTVRVGVDTDYFRKEYESGKENGLISFVGDMRTAANSDTVEYMISSILPLCKKVKKICFIGKCPDSLKNTYKHNSRVYFTGTVPDIRLEVKKARVF